MGNAPEDLIIYVEACCYCGKIITRTDPSRREVLVIDSNNHNIGFVAHLECFMNTVSDDVRNGMNLAP